MLSSDPHAWLRPIYAKLRSNPAFALLAPSHQFEALVNEVQAEHPSKAESMRDWNSTTQSALLGWLNDVVQQSAPKQQVSGVVEGNKRGAGAAMSGGLSAKRDRCAIDGG